MRSSIFSLLVRRRRRQERFVTATCRDAETTTSDPEGQSCRGALRVRDLELVIDDAVVAFEAEEAADALACKGVGQPKAVVRPHRVKGNFVKGEPCRPHLFRLG